MHFPKTWNLSTRDLVNLVTCQPVLYTCRPLVERVQFKGLKIQIQRAEKVVFSSISQVTTYQLMLHRRKSLSASYEKGRPQAEEL